MVEVRLQTCMHTVACMTRAVSCMPDAGTKSSNKPVMHSQQCSTVSSSWKWSSHPYPGSSSSGPTYITTPCISAPLQIGCCQTCLIAQNRLLPEMENAVKWELPLNSREVDAAIHSTTNTVVSIDGQLYLRNQLGPVLHACNVMIAVSKHECSEQAIRDVMVSVC